jgi:cytochrome c peroxidase
LSAAATFAACTDVSAPLADAEARQPLMAVTGVATKDVQIAVGQRIFNDKNLSRFKNQSCASCHNPDWGFNGPDDGSIESIDAAFFVGSFSTAAGQTARFGDRKPPAAAYAAFAPTLKFNNQEGTWVGGNFWDGRATGAASNSPAVDQALGPFKSSVEHAFSAVCVLWEIRDGAYAKQFETGAPVKFASLPFAKIGQTREQFCHNASAQDLPELPPNWTQRDLTNALADYNYVGVVIAEFEKSPLVSAFSAKFDAVAAGTATFTAEELQGQTLFNGRATCKQCHSSDVGREQFTDFSYYNLGVPRKNPRVLDRGLGATINNPAFNGFFKSPSLRNVAKVPLTGGRRTYMHNGVLTSLEQVVHFYNTRDLKACPAGVSFVRFPTNADPVELKAQGICWPAPDFPGTLVPQIGNIGLTPAEERALIAYMRTFTDR